MLKGFLRRFGIFGAVSVASMSAQAQHYTFTYFQDPSPNAYSTMGTDMTPTGELVGWYTNYANGVWGFSETSGTYKTISVSPSGYSGSPSTVINAINGEGTLVGYGPSTGFLMDSSGNLTTVQVPASFKASSMSTPVGINSSATVVGNFSVASGAQEGFILQNGSYKAYQVPNSYSTTLHDINDNGVIVGSYQTSSGGSSTGFLLENGTLTKIQYPGASGTVVTSINAAGHAVGYFYNKSQVFLPFYFDGAKYTQIATPGEYACTIGHIKVSGNIVGTCTNSSTFVTEAFIGTASTN